MDDKAESLSPLPETLPEAEIRAVNTRSLGTEIHTHRRLSWRDMMFDVPPGVFMPSPTARLIPDLIMDGAISVQGKHYAAMGVGLGAEAVAAGLRGARTVYGIDIHPASVAAAESNFRLHVGSDASDFVGVVSDLWSAVPENPPIDVVTFNPPMIDITLSPDPDIARTLCRGFPIAESFFAQLSQREILAPHSKIYFVLSNTAPIRRFSGLAASLGYDVRIEYERGWQGERVRTFVLLLTRAS
ncbi:hypothetical protein [Actinoplanes sp. NPDC026619]|uniref:hypothetical protein n=1 Tax=Actinoplanes sp. NPDC026619 TaxID=3155798 RepID=UPI0033CD6135